MTASTPRAPSLLQALTPLLFLVVLLVLGIVLFADDAVYGASQIALLLASGVAALVGLRNGMRWKQIEEAMVHGVSLSVGAILILLAVGALIGSWLLSGTVPTLIVYGMKLLHPSYFYPAACLICAVTSLAIGSSWTTVGTVGVALVGIGQGMDMSLAVTAGAVISGAYFGDKLSPLSDTTILAPAVSGAELFAHIRNMLWTTLPALAIALAMFAVAGFGSDASGGAASSARMAAALEAQFSPAWYLLLPMVLVFVLAFRRFPAYPAILVAEDLRVQLRQLAVDREPLPADALLGLAQVWQKRATATPEAEAEQKALDLLEKAAKANDKLPVYEEELARWLVELGYWDGYERATQWFAAWGFAAVLVAGFEVPTVGDQGEHRQRGDRQERADGESR